jgi:hypothetical protein
MVDLPTLVAALLCLAPLTPTRTAEKHARVILDAASDESEAAVLLVTGTRESTWRFGCIRGIGGRGTYGLGYGYSRWACAPLKVQAQMSLVAYHDKGAPWSWQHAIIGYLGAKSLREPEARLRVDLFEKTRERLECKCSL